VPVAVMDMGDAIISVVAVAAVPGVKTTVALSVIVDAFKVPVMVAVPVTIPDVTVAVYVPLLLSVTELNVPVVVDKPTVAPPVVRLFPFASFACTVIVDVLTPSAVMDVGEAVISDVAALAAPGANIIISLSAILEPLIFPVTVAGPATVDEVSIAVYVPLLLSVMLPIEPADVVSVIVAPPIVRLFPLMSFTCTVMIEVLVPLATIEEGDAVICVVAVLAAPGVKDTISLSVIADPFICPVMVAVPAVVDDVSVAV